MRSRRSSIELNTVLGAKSNTLVVRFVAFLLLTPATFSALDVASDTIHPDVREILADDRYQTELPIAFGDGTGVAPSEPVRTVPAQEKEAKRTTLTPDAVSTIFMVIVYAAAGVFVILLIIWLMVAFRNRSTGHDQRAPTKEGQPRAGSVIQPGARAGVSADSFDAARRCAAEGEYGEAVHLLLLGAIQRLTSEKGFPLSDSFTSRELIKHLALDDSRQRALLGLVGAVERSLFGGRPTNRETFDHCETHVHTLLPGAPQ